jgi:tetratricopeptide (TPR) repeat protein
MYYVSRISAAVSVLALLAASWFALRLAWADANFRRRTLESVARASAIMPRNAEYLAFRALQLDYDGLDSTPTLRRIAALAPLSSAPRIRLGLAAEIGGDFDSAEKWLLDAARVDRQFEPRWTLANYYFRRGNTAQFWQWMRSALEMSYGDRRPAFDLCWRMSGDPQEILSRAIPARHEVIGAYLAYLLETRRLSAAAPVALKFASAGDPNDRPLLLAAVDAFIDAGDGASARALWTAMGLPVSSDFETPGTGHGFDWRILDVPGVSHAGARIVLSGQQPESCELLRRFVSLQPHARYIVHWETRTQNIASPTGLEWRAASEHAPVLSSDDWRAGELDFTAPSEIVALTLAYRRPSGSVRAEGSVELRHIRLEESR